MANIEIMGTIVADDDKCIYEWLGFRAVCPADIHKAITEAKGEDLEVEINSGGGDVIAGNEIYTALRMYKGNVNIIISGLAASAASYIATARRCEIAPVGIFMIHNTSGGASGDYHAMDKESEVLQTVNKAIASAYTEKTGMSQEEILELMDNETWMTAEDALNYGFVDAIIESQENGKSNQMVGFFNASKTAIYNATTILDRDTINKTKEMLAKSQNIHTENITPASGVPTQPEGVLDTSIKNLKKEEVKEMAEVQENITTVEELAAKYPALTQQIKDAASLEAANAENERLKAIDEIAGQISDEMVNNAKYGEKRITAEALALEAFRKNGIMAKTALSNMEDDIRESGAEKVTPTENAGFADNSEQLDHDTKIKNLADKLRRK